MNGVFLQSELTAALARLGHEADVRAAEIAQARRLPDDLTSALVEIGVVRRGRACGGAQAHLLVRVARPHGVRPFDRRPHVVTTYRRRADR